MSGIRNMRKPCPITDQQVIDEFTTGRSYGHCAKNLGVSRHVYAGKVYRLRAKKLLPPAKEDRTHGGEACNKDLFRNGPKVKLGGGFKQRSSSQGCIDAVLSLSDKGECKWPIGDPKKDGFHFCCAESAPGAPYCKMHLDDSRHDWKPRPRRDGPTWFKRGRLLENA